MGEIFSTESCWENKINKSIEKYSKKSVKIEEKKRIIQ